MLQISTILQMKLRTQSKDYSSPENNKARRDQCGEYNTTDLKKTLPTRRKTNSKQIMVVEVLCKECSCNN